RQPSPWGVLAEWICEFKKRNGRCPVILDWATGANLARIFTECTVFSPHNGDEPTLPYLEKTVDLVAVTERESNRFDEARRVTSEAMLLISDHDPPKVTIEPLQKTSTLSSKASPPGICLAEHRGPSCSRSGPRTRKRALICSYYAPQPNLDSYSR